MIAKRTVDLEYLVRILRGREHGIALPGDFVIKILAKYLKRTIKVIKGM